MNKYNPADSYSYSSDYPRRFKNLVRFWFAGKRVWRWLRIQRPLTVILGYQYTPSSQLIEIDLTYLCNLRCNNCNRSSAQAPDAVHISLTAIREFVDQSIREDRRWNRIRLLGGEPTLHPDFLTIITEIERYIAHNPSVLVEVVTNGFGSKVTRMLSEIPATISIENSDKTDSIQPSFGPFNLAPQDSRWYRFADYRNGCSIASSCGIGLTPQGYYPCAVAGGIDRVLGIKSGRKLIPDSTDEMRDLMDVACRLCGRFRDGHYVPVKLRPPLYEQQTSESWQEIYRNWQPQGSDGSASKFSISHRQISIKETS